jgi:4-aminobutyrate aminotransferase-like enzyme
MESCKKRRLLVGRGGLYGNTIRIAPPMLVGESEIDHACDVMDQALTEISSS